MSTTSAQVPTRPAPARLVAAVVAVVLAIALITALAVHSFADGSTSPKPQHTVEQLLDCHRGAPC
jgi:hypothetical protein